MRRGSRRQVVNVMATDASTTRRLGPDLPGEGGVIDSDSLICWGISMKGRQLWCVRDACEVPNCSGGNAAWAVTVCGSTPTKREYTSARTVCTWLWHRAEWATVRTSERVRSTSRKSFGGTVQRRWTNRSFELVVPRSTATLLTWLCVSSALHKIGGCDLWLAS